MSNNFADAYTLQSAVCSMTLYVAGNWQRNTKWKFRAHRYFIDRCVMILLLGI